MKYSIGETDSSTGHHLYFQYAKQQPPTNSITQQGYKFTASPRIYHYPTIALEIPADLWRLAVILLQYELGTGLCYRKTWVGPGKTGGETLDVIKTGDAFPPPDKKWGYDYTRD